MGKNSRLKLVVDRKSKPRRKYAGEPLECKACGNRNLMELRSPTVRDGKVVKGSHSTWMCPYCQTIVWP